MANDSDPSPQPRREPAPAASRNLDANPDRGDGSGSASAASLSSRLKLQATSSDGQIQVDYRGDSHWHAMHRLAHVVSQDGPDSREVDRVTLTDRDATYGATAQRDGSGAFELQFESEDSKALYRQIVRERQMELAVPADNRISALGPQLESRSNGKASRQDEGPELLRTDIAAALSAAEGDEPRAKGRGTYIERQVLDRATFEQLRELKRIADEAQPDALREALRALQRQIETEVVRSEIPRTTVPRASEAPSVGERFTVQDRLGRRDYWYRDRPDRLAFTQSWLSLRTKEHSNAALMGMVDRAVELGWKRLHLEGSAEFKREAWILAHSRGLEARGYTATMGDREAAEAERRRHKGPQLHQQVAPPPQRELVQKDRPADKGARGDEVTSEQLRQVVRKAIKDTRVSPELETRLLRLLEQEHQRRRSAGKSVQIQRWDSAAPRTRAQTGPAVERGTQRIQRER